MQGHTLIKVIVVVTQEEAGLRLPIHCQHPDPIVDFSPLSETPWKCLSTSRLLAANVFEKSNNIVISFPTVSGLPITRADDPREIWIQKQPLTEVIVIVTQEETGVGLSIPSSHEVHRCVLLAALGGEHICGSHIVGEAEALRQLLQHLLQVLLGLGRLADKPAEASKSSAQIAQSQDAVSNFQLLSLFITIMEAGG